MSRKNPKPKKKQWFSEGYENIELSPNELMKLKLSDVIF